MKINLKKVIILLIVLIVVVAGCSKAGNSTKGGSSSTSKLPDKLENPNITILYNGELGDATEESIRQFEEKYGGKVSYITTIINEKPTKLISLVSAGESPDAVTWGLQHMPRWAIQNLVQPVDSYFDFNDPIFNMDILNQVKYNGKHYGVMAGDLTPFFIYYNKTMFENNGVKTPMEYYKEGKWNWDNFRKVAIELTQDIDKDGAIDQWGLAHFNRPDLFVYSNGGRFVEFNSDGTIELRLSDSKTVEALQFFQDGVVKDKYSIQKVDFISGKAAMTFERPGKDALKSMKYEWDIVPIPFGPSGKQGTSASLCTFWGIPVGSKNPEGAAAWLNMHVKIAEEYEPAEEDKLYTDAQEKLIKELKKNVTLIKYVGVSKMSNELWNPIRNGQPVQTVLDSVIPIYQGEVEALLK